MSQKIDWLSVSEEKKVGQRASMAPNLPTVRETNSQCSQCNELFEKNEDGSNISWWDSQTEKEMCYCCSSDAHQAYEQNFIPNAVAFINLYNECEHQQENNEPFSVSNWRDPILHCQHCNMLKDIMLWHVEQLDEKFRVGVHQ